MSSANRSRGLAMAALAVAALLAGCASQSAAEKAAEVEAARVAAEIAARTPPPIALNAEVAEAASIYVAFTREMAAMEGGYADAASVQAALQRGSSYDPVQLSRGLVAYASIVALQSPEFVQSVQRYALDRTTREQLAANIAADPRWASQLPGADAAAGLIMSTLRTDIDGLTRAANSIENDAYGIQAAYDPRRPWGVAPVADRVGRLEDAKARSARPMLPSAEDSARLLTAAHGGGGLAVSRDDRQRTAPYPAVIQQALAIAALAALGEAGDNARARTDALQTNTASQTCLAESKLNLFQCLAASRPSYEDMFCIGRHIVRDLATCTRGSALPAGVAMVSDLAVAETPRPRITVTPAPDLTPAPSALPPVQTPVPTVVQTPVPTTARPLSPTERLNSGPNRTPD